MDDLQRLQLVASLAFAGYLVTMFVAWMGLDLLHRHYQEHRTRRNVNMSSLPPGEVEVRTTERQNGALKPPVFPWNFRGRRGH